MKNGKNGINLNVSRQLKFLYIIRSSPCRMSRGGSVGLVEKNISLVSGVLTIFPMYPSVCGE